MKRTFMLLLILFCCGALMLLGGIWLDQSLSFQREYDLALENCERGHMDKALVHIESAIKFDSGWSMIDSDRISEAKHAQMLFSKGFCEE